MSDGKNLEDALAARRAALAECFASLPIYNSHAFWSALQSTSIPLEVITRCFRMAHLYEEYSVRDRLFALLVQRIQRLNIAWAQALLRTTAVSMDVRTAFVNDLCADLYEQVLHALLDPSKHFWEEHFLHCLRLERQHVYKAFMMREGYWQELRVKQSMRVPRALVVRLDALLQPTEFVTMQRDVADEQAEKRLQEVESTELLLLLQALPAKLKTVLYLLFWEGLSEKEVAESLHVTDRTVRNRKKAALTVLRQRLTEGEAVSYAARAHERR